MEIYYHIITKPMQPNIAQPSPIYNAWNLSEEKAIELFKEACQLYNLDNATESEAGGIGYDYRCEIIAE